MNAWSGACTTYQDEKLMALLSNNRATSSSSDNSNTNITISECIDLTDEPNEDDIIDLEKWVLEVEFEKVIKPEGKNGSNTKCKTMGRSKDKT